MGSIIRPPNYIAKFLPFLQELKGSYAMATRLKRLFFMIGKAKELYDEIGIDK